METVRNTRGNLRPEVPLKADRSYYRYELIYDGAKYRAYADTISELCAVLIGDGYPGAGELEAAAARIRYTVSVQVGLQASFVGEQGLSSCTPAERELLLGPRHVPPRPGVWEADLPLVLVDTYYDPLGALPRPVGRPRGGGGADSNLIWLSPSTEESLLRSLAAAGVVVLSEARREGE
jgi:hypothetical protein